MIQLDHTELQTQFSKGTGPDLLQIESTDGTAIGWRPFEKRATSA